MKLQFSLATLLVAVTLICVIASIASLAFCIKIHEPMERTSYWSSNNGGISIESIRQPYDRSPTLLEFARRMALWGTPAITGTVGLLWAIRRLKSRREKGPPVG
jgi:hypothetical protein